MTKRIVFDVESVGLHGEGFAVGWVVLDEYGREVSCGLAFCDPDAASAGVHGDRAWVAEHVVPGLEAAQESIRLVSPFGVREAFWRMYQALKADGPVELWADCPWPVEARFLISCVQRNTEDRNWQGPYPLLDVGVMMRAAGMDAMMTYDRLPSEMPAHNPLADARQSARLLLDAERRLASR